MKRALLVLALVASACTKDNPTNPSPTPTPTPTPTPSTVSLSGTVSAQAGGRVAGATVRFLDGANAGRSVTANGNGEYRFDGVTRGDANLGAAAPGYEENRRGIFVDNNTLSFTLRTIEPWRQTGGGNSVFTMPSYFDRVRIRGTWNGSSTSNFIVRIGGSLVVNEILRDMPGRTYEGVHLTRGGGTVEITNSGNVTVWSFTEER